MFENAGGFKRFILISSYLEYRPTGTSSRLFCTAGRLYMLTSRSMVLNKRVHKVQNKYNNE